MNAKTQLAELKTRMEAIKEASVDANVDYFDKDWTILQDMKAVLDDRIERFGDNAYSLSDKQWVLAEKILAEKQAALPLSASVEPSDEAVAEIARTLDANFDYDKGYDDAVFVAARHIARGEWTRFQAKQHVEMMRQSRDAHVAEMELFGMSYGEYIYWKHPASVSEKLEWGWI